MDGCDYRPTLRRVPHRPATVTRSGDPGGSLSFRRSPRPSHPNSVPRPPPSTGSTRFSNERFWISIRLGTSTADERRAKLRRVRATSALDKRRLLRDSRDETARRARTAARPRKIAQRYPTPPAGRIGTHGPHPGRPRMWRGDRSWMATAIDRRPEDTAPSPGCHGPAEPPLATGCRSPSCGYSSSLAPFSSLSSVFRSDSSCPTSPWSSLSFFCCILRWRLVPWPKLPTTTATTLTR